MCLELRKNVGILDRYVIIQIEAGNNMIFFLMLVGTYVEFN